MKSDRVEVWMPISKLMAVAIGRSSPAPRLTK
jgi:hypothetical protein